MVERRSTTRRMRQLMMTTNKDIAIPLANSQNLPYFYP